MSAKSKFLKQLSHVSAFTLLSRILGFIREIVQLSCIGVNHLSDALTGAIMLPSMIRKLTSEGLFNAAFIPIYHELQTNKSEKEANIWASNIIFLIFFSTLFLLLFLQFFIQFILSIFCSGFLSKPTWPLLIQLARIIFLSIIGSSLSSFVNTIWTAKKNFFMASIGSSICNISIISFSLFASNVYHLAIAYAIGTYVQFFFTLYPLRHNIYFQKTTHKIYIIKFFKLLLPLLTAALVLQYLTVTTAWFGSWLHTGQFTYINKADKLIQLPISLIGVTLNTILIPTLIKTKHIGYTTYSTKIGLLLSSFIFCFIFTLNQDISYLTFGYGKMSTQDTQYIGNILLINAFGLTAWILIKIFQASLSSIQDKHSTLIANLIHLFTYISLGLITLSKPDMYTLATISVISVWINLSFLTIQIYRKKLLGKIIPFLITLLISTALFSFFSIYINSFLNHILLRFTITGLTLSGCFLALYMIMRKYKI